MNNQYTKRIYDLLAKRKTALEGTINRVYYGNEFMVLFYDDGTYVYIRPVHGYDDEVGLDLTMAMEPYQMQYAGMITQEEHQEYLDLVTKNREKRERQEWERLNLKYGKRKDE